MAFTTFVAGQVLTAAQVNDYLMKQSVIVCTNATRPTGTEGMVIYETDTEKLFIYNGSTFSSLVAPAHGTPQSYASTLAGSGWAIGDGTISFRYVRVGRFIAYDAKVTFGSTSTFGAGNPTLSLPATAAYDSEGVSRLQNTGSGSAYGSALILAGGSTVTVRAFAVSGSNIILGSTTSTVPHSWADTDQMIVSGHFFADADA